MHGRILSVLLLIAIAWCSHSLSQGVKQRDALHDQLRVKESKNNWNSSKSENAEKRGFRNEKRSKTISSLAKRKLNRQFTSLSPEEYLREDLLSSFSGLSFFRVNDFPFLAMNDRELIDYAVEMKKASSAFGSLGAVAAEGLTHFHIYSLLKTPEGYQTILESRLDERDTGFYTNWHLKRWLRTHESEAIDWFKKANAEGVLSEYPKVADDLYKGYFSHMVKSDAETAIELFYELGKEQQAEYVSEIRPALLGASPEMLTNFTANISDDSVLHAVVKDLSYAYLKTQSLSEVIDYFRESGAFTDEQLEAGLRDTFLSTFWGDGALTDQIGELKNLFPDITVREIVDYALKNYENGSERKNSAKSRDYLSFVQSIENQETRDYAIEKVVGALPLKPHALNDALPLIMENPNVDLRETWLKGVVSRAVGKPKQRELVQKAFEELGLEISDYELDVE